VVLGWGWWFTGEGVTVTFLSRFCGVFVAG